ncbi:hypothetical protein CDAR_278421 [Caerostris darwini]|uniref:Uncharacterized protein n=1 Tax=Caerostris darwini TaxID=1538125 RepID=A0AAV4WN85_9ARAC|nr:hypothetical protein CDAR_278421 [Caerostris darwini]
MELLIYSISQRPPALSPVKNETKIIRGDIPIAKSATRQMSVHLSWPHNSFAFRWQVQPTTPVHVKGLLTRGPPVGFVRGVHKLGSF